MPRSKIDFLTLYPQRKYHEPKPETFVWSTTGYHVMGDIINTDKELAVIYNETAQYYIGYWSDHPSLLNVIFPKQSTTLLSEDEYPNLKRASWLYDNHKTL